jgi:CBS domain-containing membrane protein
MNEKSIWECDPVEISDQDILSAMKAMNGYIDITPGDFREVYRVAYRVAKSRLMNAMKAGDVMTTPVTVVQSDMDLVDTAVLLNEKNISGAPVVDRTGRIIGVVSERDFLRNMGAVQTLSFMGVIANCLKNRGCVAIPMRNRKAADIMTSPAVTGNVEMPVSEISSLLTEKELNRIPIVDNNGKPIGIVTRADLMTSYCRLS